MANEAIIIELFDGGRPIRYTVTNATAVPKGTIMKLTDPRSMAACDSSAVPIAGIAAAEKVASDGATSLAVYTDGIFGLKCVAGSGSAVLGEFVRFGTANAVANNEITVSETLDIETGKAIGRALEEGSAGETISVRVKL